MNSISFILKLKLNKIKNKTKGFDLTNTSLNENSYLFFSFFGLILYKFVQNDLSLSCSFSQYMVSSDILSVTGMRFACLYSVFLNQLIFE